MKKFGLRRKFTGRRFKKSRFSNKRVSAQSWKTTTLVPRTLYPPLPAEMRLCLKASTINNYAVVGTSMTIQSVSCINPQQIGGDFPSGFGPMMLLYGRAIVDRVTVKFTLVPYFAGTAPLDPTTFGPLDVTAAVLPWVDTQALALNDASYRRIAARADAKTLSLSHPYADNSKTFFFSVDVRKALYSAHEEHYTIKSDRDGILTLPVQAQLQESPQVSLAVYNQFGTTRYYSVRRDVTYHMGFSMPHTTSLVVPVA